MKHFFIYALLVIGLIGCAVVPNSPETDESGRPEKVPTLSDKGPAPELTNEVWLNTEAPLRLAELRGKVVLLDMWTYG